MSKLHALIIDDNPRNLSVLARLLAMQGVSSTEVQKSLHIDDILNAVDAVDVVFLDLEMPNHDGYEVLEALKSTSRFQSVPIVAYSVHTSEIQTAYQKGFHSFLGKPLDSDKFPEQLSRILKGQAVWEVV
jgi:CheY-like chemotaxis protein